MTHQGQDPYGGGTPPPPGQQPGYQQQPPPPGRPGQPGGMAQQGPVQDEGLQPPVASLLAYLFLGIGGLVIFLTQRNPEVRFHGAQSLLLGIAVVGIWILYLVLFTVFGIVDPTGFIVGLVGLLVWLVLLVGFFGLYIYMCIQGYQMRHKKLPVIGNFAEQWAGGAATV